MKVMVLAPGKFHSDKIDENGYLELKENTTVSQVLKMIKMPKLLAKIMLASVNGQIVPLNTALKEGDTLGFFSGIAGG